VRASSIQLFPLPPLGKMKISFSPIITQKTLNLSTREGSGRLHESSTKGRLKKFIDGSRIHFL